jgi:rRNA processing protein Krr1/Pno1
VSNLTPAAIASTLASIGKDIDDLTARLVEAEGNALALRREHRRAYALAILKHKVGPDGKAYSVAERDALALLDTQETLEAFEVAQYAADSARDELRAKRDRLEIGRSLSALVRMEFSAS